MNLVTELQRKDHAGWWNPELHLLAMFIHGIMPTINTAVEIGVQTDGSADVWLRFVPADGMYVGVDINLYDPKQGLYAAMDGVKVRFATDSRVNLLIADSTKAATLDSVKGILNQTRTGVRGIFRRILERPASRSVTSLELTRKSGTAASSR